MVMTFKQFSERIHLMETLSLVSNDGLEILIKFANGALLIRKFDKLESIPKEVGRELMNLEPWILHLTHELELEDEDLIEFREIVVEAMKIKKLVCRMQTL